MEGKEVKRGIFRKVKGKQGESEVMWPLLTSSHSRKALAEQLDAFIHAALQLDQKFNYQYVPFTCIVQEAGALSNMLAYYAVYTNPASTEIHSEKATSHRRRAEGLRDCYSVEKHFLLVASCSFISTFQQI